MAPHTRAKTFSSALVPFVLSLVRANGADASKLERRYLRPNLTEGNPLPEISLADLAGLLADAAKTVKDPLFGLHAAQAMPRGSYGLLEFALRCAPTGLESMKQLAEFGALINPLVRWSLQLDGDEVALHHRAPTKDGVGRHGNIFTVARILAASRQLMGEQLKPTRAWFAHQEKSCPPELRELLGTDRIAFGRSSNGIAFTVEDMDRPVEGADAELNRVLVGHATALLKGVQDDDLHLSARRAVVGLLPKGNASLAKTAKKLNLSARTLQRRLTGEGIAFSSLVAEVRRDEAERLLRRSSASLSEVGEAVGYSDTGAFVRAFRRWTGTTPGKFREQLA